jgi:hypothetical protein
MEHDPLLLVDVLSQPLIRLQHRTQYITSLPSLLLCAQLICSDGGGKFLRRNGCISEAKHQVLLGIGTPFSPLFGVSFIQSGRMTCWNNYREQWK